MKTVEVAVYKFEELSQESKKYALEQNRDFYDDVISDIILESYEIQLSEFGYPTEDISFSLGYCQGDGMAFYGNIDLEVLIEKKATELEKYGLSTHDFRRVRFLINEGMELNIVRNSFGHHYSHYNTMDLSSDYVELYAHEESNTITIANLQNSWNKFENFIANDIKETSKILEHCGYEDIEHYKSDEKIEEVLIDNEYNFSENGKMFYI